MPTDDPGRVVRRALSYLRQSGHAVELIGGNFIFPKDDERVFGTGENWVYCYYLTIQKKQGASQFPWTIGRTSGGTIKSIRKYIERQARKAIVDPPKIPLLFRTNECVDLEGAIHRILRLRDQQIDAPGDELFMTNPEEVLEIYDFIDRLEAHYGEISAHFILPLAWQRCPKKTYSLISMCRDGNIGASADELEAIRDWHVESLLKFKTVFQPIIEKLLR